MMMASFLEIERRSTPRRLEIGVGQLVIDLLSGISTFEFGVR